MLFFSISLFMFTSFLLFLLFYRIPIFPPNFGILSLPSIQYLDSVSCIEHAALFLQFLNFFSHPRFALLPGFARTFRLVQAKNKEAWEKIKPQSCQKFLWNGPDWSSDISLHRNRQLKKFIHNFVYEFVRTWLSMKFGHFLGRWFS